MQGSVGFGGPDPQRESELTIATDNLSLEEIEGNVFRMSKDQVLNELLVRHGCFLVNVLGFIHGSWFNIEEHVLRFEGEITQFLSWKLLTSWNKSFEVVTELLCIQSFCARALPVSTMYGTPNSVGCNRVRFEGHEHAGWGFVFENG